MPEPPTAAVKTTNVTGLVIALLVAVFAFQLNASMLSPALATMERELDTTTAQIGVSQTAFFTAAALFSLFLPRWGDLIGRRRVLTLMLLVTGIGCVVSAVAPSVGVLFVGRIIQGVAGPVVPICLIMLRVQVPDPKLYATLLGVLTAVNGGIAGVDALAGGWLAGSFGFRSIFWVMAVICVIAVVAVRGATVESTAVETPPMDWKGVAPLVVAIGCALVAFNQAGELATANWVLVIVLLLVAAAAFGVFWRIEDRSPHPLVSTHYLRQRRTWALLSTTLLTMTGVFAIMNGLIPNLAQDPAAGPGIGADAVSWVTLTPYALAGLVIGPVAGRLAGTFGYKRVLQIGLIGTVVGVGIAVLTASSPSPGLLLVVSLFIGVTYAGISNIMLNGLGIVLSPEDNPGYLPGLNAGAFNLGAGISFAVLFAVDTLVATGSGPRAGYTAGIVTGGVLVLLALAVSVLIPRPDPSAVAARIEGAGPASH
ncbi:MFS transporter [Tersicoccus sp. Bi-70]|uniref:uridine transporter UriT n=1 Tax=Tersicoccus sp. Bi-70 TaxID=1897634 RepID=UPI000975C6EC|nr:MFS transporter [Tersicoccus sp. Bi-70]OMH34105.1 multidrug ABC transporter [Tersicoccus sp. Bi-70]